jgi:signal transduction histidine kinase/ActR/RegA family two-component response regulator
MDPARLREPDTRLRLSRRIFAALAICSAPPLAVVCGIVGTRFQAWPLALGLLAAGGLLMVLLAWFLSRRMVPARAVSGSTPESSDAAGMDRDAAGPPQGQGRDVFHPARVGSLAELAGGIAHEINNPVAIMVEEAGWIEDLLDEEEFQQSPNLQEFRRALKQIKTQGARCKEITQNLLSFARSTDPKVKEIQLDDLLKEVVQNCAKRIDNPNVRLSANLAGNLPPLRVSPTEMQQVFMNLVNNALDALGPRGGTVEIASRLDGGRIVVDVSDTGEGIPEDILGRIFEPFFTTKPVGKGTGLGLAICYGIIDRLGGRISVKSRPGEGTTFRVEIPIGEAAAEEKRLETETPTPEVGPEPSPAAGEGIFGEPPTTVLVVDDEQAFVDAMAKRLSKRNLSVLKALSAEEALRQLAENPNVDVVILDVNLSGMDGLETLAAIQRAGYLAEVILLSGHTTVEAAIEGIKRGAFDYLMKPCDMALLFGQIEKARAKKRRREQTLLEDRIRDITMRRM